MTDTTEAGAGSYPEPDEQELTCYRVKLIATNVIECIVYSKNEEDAKRLAFKSEWDDLESETIKVEEIIDIEKVEN